EDWRSGFARDFQTRLERYISDILPKYPGSFSGFHWEEREDVQKARQIARKEGSDTVMEKHLFLGILETESKTRQALKNALGEKDFGQLVDFIRSCPDQSPGTPGTEDIF